MSVEAQLTLGLALLILAVALVLKIAILTLLKVSLRLAGKDTSWLTPERGERRSRPPLERRVVPKGRTVAAGGRKLAAGAAFIAATLVSAARSTGRRAVTGAAALEARADAINARLAPRSAEVTRSARRSVTAAGRRLGPYLVAAIATVQHLFSGATGWVGSRARFAQSRHTPSEPTKVIDLDRDDDLLGQPRRRSSAEIRL